MKPGYCRYLAVVVAAVGACCAAVHATGLPAQEASTANEIEERLSYTVGRLPAQSDSVVVPNRSLSWPDISYRDHIPLYRISIGTRLKWTAAMWLPALARGDLVLQVYPLSALDHVTAQDIARGPVFAVLAVDDEPRIASRAAGCRPAGCESAGWPVRNPWHPMPNIPQ